MVVLEKMTHYFVKGGGGKRLGEGNFERQDDTMTIFLLKEGRY
jgi:hypothetical protein